MDTNLPLQYVIIYIKGLFILGIKPELKYDHSLESSQLQVKNSLLGVYIPIVSQGGGGGETEKR